MAEKQPPAAPVTQSQDAEPKKRKGALTNEDVLMTHVAPCLSYMDLFSLVKTTKEMRSRLTHEHALTAVLLNADDKFGKNAKHDDPQRPVALREGQNPQAVADAPAAPGQWEEVRGRAAVRHARGAQGRENAAGLGLILLLAAHGRRFGRNLALQKIPQDLGRHHRRPAHVPALHVQQDVPLEEAHDSCRRREDRAHRHDAIAARRQHARRRTCPAVPAPRSGGPRAREGRGGY